jgi:hypothetical protein
VAPGRAERGAATRDNKAAAVSISGGLDRSPGLSAFTPAPILADCISESACEHARTCLSSDVSAASGIGPWYVQCLDCGAAGPTDAEVLERADFAHDALVGLMLSARAHAGDAAACAVVAEVLAGL